MSTRILFVHALSPLHAGTGQSVGAVDLAISRDRATELPTVPGSSIKGSLRDLNRKHPLTKALFGPEPRIDDVSEHRGGALFGDANLLLLPVRSVAGTFAWASSPYLLARFARDMGDLGVATPAIPSLTSATPAASDVGRCLLAAATLKVGSRVIFEDLDLVPDASATLASEWASLLGKLIFPNDPVWQGYLTERLCIVHDDLMSFLARHGTAVVARVALDPETKTVQNLWHEESLPPETVFCGLVHADPPAAAKTSADALLDHLGELVKRTSIQFGGKATVGRGRVRLVLSGGVA